MNQPGIINVLMNFKDCFSAVSDGYASYRPGYPAALFSWLASIVPGREVAWDCACGSGQATLPLAEHFRRVVATDASEAQVGSAPKDSATIEWRVAPAEESGLPGHSVDLLTVAQALHWFDLPRFYAEAHRVLRERGIIAVWTYGMNQIEGEPANARVQHFYSEVVGPYWPPERKLVETGYRTLAFPFREFEPPAFQMEAHWTLDQLLGYFRTWSATSRYIAANKSDPVDPLRAELEPLWGPPENLRLITWPLTLRVGSRSE